MTTIRHGSVSVTWNESEFRSALDGAMSDLERVGLEQITAETRFIYENAKRFWPVLSGKSRDSLGWRVSHNDSEIKGEVRAAASYARYISSAQISTSSGIPSARLRAMHAEAETPEQHRAIRELAAKGTPHKQSLRAYVSGPGGGKLTGKAARNGSAMWLLLRWPEKAAADRLTHELGPLLEDAIRPRLEG